MNAQSPTMSPADSGAPDPVAAKTEAQYRAEVLDVLRAHQRRQLGLYLIGPLASVVLHLLILGVMSVLVVTQRSAPHQVLTVQMRPLEVVEIDPIIDDTFPPDDPNPRDDSTAPEVEPSDPPPPTDPTPFTEPGCTGNPVAPGPEFPPSEVDFDQLPALAAMSDTPLKLPGVWQGRTDEGRERLIREHQVPRAQEEAVERAMNWLAKIQLPNGSWANNPAHTGMALLVFLAHGETQNSPTYGDTVLRAMLWEHQRMMDAPADGTLGQRGYAWGIATYALAESYGMTGIPMLRVSMEKGLARIVAGQQPGGGFDYNFAKGERWDLSVAGWQFQALKAGIAAQARTPGLHEAADRAVVFLKGTAYKNKKFGYATPGSGGNMTGAGAVALQLLGERKSTEAMAAADTIARERLELYKGFMAGKKDFKREAGKSIYGWYYDTQVMFNKQDADWRAWDKVFGKVLVKAQHPDGYWAVEDGTGMNDTDDTGRILSTAWCVLQLEVYYRYLPTMDQAKMAAADGRMARLDDDKTGLLIVQ